LRTRAVVLAVLASTPIVTACGDTGPPAGLASRPPPVLSRPSTATSEAATRFLARYVTSDGRVIRHDQGGDIVSEGQAYGMLIADIGRRPAIFRTIWSWTRTRLGRSDGLFASHATGSGQIEDPHSATDADILIALALLSYTGPDRAELHRAGQRVATAVLEEESIRLPDGTPLPVAGPWAKTTSEPIVNPSYLMPGVFAALGGLTGDDRWNQAAGQAIALVGDLSSGGRVLPPDWAKLSGGRLVAIANPGGGAGIQYSFDAARLPIWFATACSSGARAIAAGWWRNVLGSDGRSGPQALSLNGAKINPAAADSPLPLFAGAAAATAAGEQSAARELRVRAAALALQDPTYYGDAWVALGRALLDGSISPCNE
jgi:endoglucanase